MEAYSMDLRVRVVAACDEGIETRQEIAERFQVSKSWIRRLLQRRRETGSIAPLPHGGGPWPIFDERRLQRLGQLVKQKPDATLTQLRKQMRLKCSLSVISEALKKFGLTFKKKYPSGRARSRGRPSAPRGLETTDSRHRSISICLPR